MRFRAVALSLLLSAAQAAAPTPAPTQATSAAQSGTYTVQTGDTLYAIARRVGTTVERLQALNNLSDAGISVGQVLRVPQVAGQVTITPAKPAAPALGTSAASSAGTASAAPNTSGNIFVVNGVTVVAPFRAEMGDAFVLRLSGARAGQARVRFTSEVGEDVRRPAEALTPIGAAGEYVVLGRVVLGKKTPIVYTVQVDGKTTRARIPVVAGDIGRGSVVPLNLPKAIADKLVDPGRKAEEALVEQAYARRTPQAWDLPFQPAVQARVIPGSFGQNRTYVAGQPVKYHYGADYPAPVGTPITAVNDGTVVLAGKYPVRGNVVAIDHGAGLISLYFHQSKLLVKVGQRVTRGQRIGLVGSTGLSTGPHLHLEMRVRGEATQPADWFGRLFPRPK